ncbi:MAG: hypothetical protein EAZ95_14245 [Bacteroidetes bacterium]|nr:MAG: hypothetical protein EAZ95_14245 [Bacteroidota bacterium]
MLQKIYLSILACLLAMGNLPAQNAQVGEPVITNYDPHEYTKFVDNMAFLDNLAKQSVKGGLSSGWSIAQTSNGKMYFGTTAGVLEFDGYKWDMIFLVNSTNKGLVGARSLCYDKNIDRLYVGAHNDFGYLEKSKNGKMTFISLYEKFKEKIKKAVGKDIAEIWSVRIHKGEVYFHSRFALMIYNGKDIRVIPTQESYHRLFSVQQKLYLRQEGIGLCRLENDKLTPLAFGEMFANSPNFQISGMIPYYKGGMLIGTRREGLFVYGEYGSTKEEVFSKQGISPEVDNRLKEAQIYHIRQLADGKIAIGTLREGLFILDKDLQILHHFNEEKGLQGSSVLYIFQDKINNIWVITFKGIAKIELNSPLTRWDERQNMNTRLHSLIEYKGDMYASLSISGRYFCAYLTSNRQGNLHLFWQVC